MGIFIPRITWSSGGYASLLQAKHLNTLQEEHSVLNSPSGGSRISHTGWGADPKRQGRQPIIWATFSRALHELGKNWTQVGGGGNYYWIACLNSVEKFFLKWKVSWKLISFTASIALWKSMRTVCIHAHHLRAAMYHPPDIWSRNMPCFSEHLVLLIHI